jgi:hypothetical protein
VAWRPVGRPEKVREPDREDEDGVLHALCGWLEEVASLPILCISSWSTAPPCRSTGKAPPLQIGGAPMLLLCISAVAPAQRSLEGARQGRQPMGDWAERLRRGKYGKTREMEQARGGDYIVGETWSCGERGIAIGVWREALRPRGWWCAGWTAPSV